MNEDYLYIMESIQDNNTNYKIGVTNNLEKRIKNIRTGNPYPVNYIYTEKNKNSYKLEKWLHSQFSKNKLEGEWFTGLTYKEIRNKIFQFNNSPYDLDL